MDEWDSLEGSLAFLKGAMARTARELVGLARRHRDFAEHSRGIDALRRAGNILKGAIARRAERRERSGS